MPFSADQRRAALLFVQFLEELGERAEDGSAEEALLVASEAVGAAFDVDTGRDAAALNPTNAKLLEALQLPSLGAAVAAETENVVAPAEEQIADLARLKDSAKFTKYLEVVTGKGIFKGAEKGTQEYVDRLRKVVAKFVSTFPTELSAAAGGGGGGGAASAPKPSGPEATAAAESFKAVGNQKVKEKDFRGAVAAYSQAIDADPEGPSAHVYYGNRAAARQHLGDFAGAAEDARSAIRVNPDYVKSYTRLAMACIELKHWDEAIQASEDALARDDSNASASQFLAKARRGKAAAAASVAAAPAPAPAAAPAPGGAGGMPDLSALLSGLGGGGGGGGGGMPDLSSLMSNPMVQGMMQNPQMMQSVMGMMQNPAMMQSMMGAMGGAAGGGGGGGGMPDLSAMMNDPNIRQMAEQVRGSLGAAGAGAAAGGSADDAVEIDAPGAGGNDDAEEID